MTHSFPTRRASDLALAPGDALHRLHPCQPQARDALHRRHQRYRPSRLGTPRRPWLWLRQQVPRHRLVHVEPHEEIAGAIQREKTLKEWPRAWKIRLIERGNPEWEDLYERMNR